MVTIIAAAVIPFLSGYVLEDAPYTKILVGAMDVMVASLWTLSMIKTEHKKKGEGIL